MILGLRDLWWVGWLAVGAIGGCSGGGGGDTDATGVATTTGTTDASTSTGGPTGEASTTTGGTTAAASTSTDAGTTGAPTTGEPTTGEPTTEASTTTTDPSTTTGPIEPVGSAGCGAMNPSSGAHKISVQGQSGQYIVSLPPNYDPNTPYPLGFAFHGRNRTGPNCQDGDCAGFQAAMQEHAILIYMTSLGGTGWEGDGEREINAEFFTAVLDRMVGEYCVDEARVFAAGTSSGAHFVNILGCRFGDRLLAIAPVAGYLPEKDGCVDKVAALVIHGIADVHVPFDNGEQARDFWRERDGCGEDTVPTIAEVHAAVEAEPESHACAAYQGCDPGAPVVWCEHSEGGYDDTTHGWPLFGGQRIWEFVQGL
ncbi:alpha/beta hydrolase family esterase [Nannocystis bainbridge]|uniref:Poly(3-hydroxybutyrate) depolymerase n=1 Tax=Nannocystis bainbridge TaxID=2995303 RepID=A0ABT5ECD5_9BACT|nr:hypothetical protein [Nannocystis bainbridge]MDC0722446.1 hypothetical protein [Nannocystis bainbridge]